jgi:hypothetical protein
MKNPKNKNKQQAKSGLLSWTPNAWNDYLFWQKENPKVVDVFAQIWNVNRDELLVSFDASSFHLPPEDTNRGFFRNNYWFHSDQSFTRNNFSRVYINGVLASSTDSTPLNGISINPSDANAQIAKINPFHSGCRIAVARLYNRPLSAAEVLQNYNAQKSRFGL